MARKTGSPDIKGWMQSVEPVRSRVCLSCQEPWNSSIREVLEELANGSAGPGVTLSSLHRFLASDAFDDPYAASVSALRAHVRTHEKRLHSAWCQRDGKFAGA
jgi:hypothetical protein